MPKPPRILILEDSVLVAMELEAAVIDRGYLAITAGSLAAASRRLAEAPCAAALLDVMLPDGTSFELARGLLDRGCPVAILSGTDDDAFPQGLAFAKHFRKPVDTDRVMRWIAGQIESQPANEAPGLRGPAPREP